MLFWASNMLVNAEGDPMACYHAHGNDFEWFAYKSVDPDDNTRGTSRSETAARKAMVKAVAKFGYLVTS